jgi:hypothetical protein
MSRTTDIEVGVCGVADVRVLVIPICKEFFPGEDELL